MEGKPPLNMFPDAGGESVGNELDVARLWSLVGFYRHETIDRSPPELVSRNETNRTNRTNKTCEARILLAYGRSLSHNKPSVCLHEPLIPPSTNGARAESRPAFQSASRPSTDSKPRTEKL